jgi:hypothetical protein
MYQPYTRSPKSGRAGNRSQTAVIRMPTESAFVVNLTEERKQRRAPTSVTGVLRPASLRPEEWARERRCTSDEVVW